MRVLFLAPYPADESPSQRYRFEHYLPFLQEQGISYSYRPFLARSAWKIFFKPGHLPRKAMGVMGGYLRRFFLLFTVPRYDFVFIHREAAPLGPPVFEWLIAKLFRKKIIYDFDDAIWIPSVSSYNKAVAWLKSFSKVAKICKWSYKVVVGNKYLGDYARRYNNRVVEIPTVVNTDSVHNQVQDQLTQQPAIGWTGTFSTLKYLDIVLPVLQELQQEIDFIFYVIADKDPQLPLEQYRFVRWAKEREAADLLQFHIGLMPLYDDEISKGKCGFKAIQYMSLGIPALVSPVGVNTVIVEHGVNGYICNNPEEWKNSLRLLLKDSEIRKKTGQKARQRIEEAYSVQATKRSFLDLFS